MKRENYRIGIYTRESRDDNEENYETIETQRDMLMDFAARSELGQVVSVYMDDNASGSGFSRNGIEGLREDVVKAAINLLVLKDLSRLGRNNAKTLLFLDFLEEHGVRVLTMDGRYDSLRDNDTVGIETWFNERYIRDISRKIRSSLRFRIQRGEYVGSAPYGYRKSSTEKNRLVVDPETAPVVREIYRLYRNGMGYGSIANQLQEAGYPSPGIHHTTGRTTGEWSAGSVRRILCSRVYTGDTVQGVSEKVSFKSRKTRRLPEENWVVTKGTHEPVISWEEYRAVQEIRLGRVQSLGPGRGITHPFRNLLYCGSCGSPMFARKRENRTMGYICGNYAGRGRNACSSHFIREKRLMDILKQEILKRLEQPETFKKLADRLENEAQQADQGKTDYLRQQLVSRSRQQELLYADRLEGRISVEFFDRLNRGMEDRIQKLKQELSRYERQAVKPDGMEAVCQCMTSISRTGLTNGELMLFVGKITVYDHYDMESGKNPCNEELWEDEGVVVIDFRTNKV